MKFSMWIVNDWLREFNPSPRITKGEMEIKGVRYFGDSVSTEEGLLYVGHTKDFIPTQNEGVICAYGEDLLLLETGDIYLVFNKIQQMLEYYNEWEMSILRSIEEGASINEILEATLPVLDTTILVTDASHSILGIAHHPNEIHHFHYEKDGRISAEDVIRLNEILKKYVSTRGPYITDGGHEPKDIIRNFYASNGDLIGWFVVMEGADERFVHSKMQLTEAFCRLLDFWFRINENALMLSPQSAIFIDILDGKESDPASINFRKESIGWTGDPEMQLFVIASKEISRLDLSFLQSSMSSSFSGFYCFNYMADAVVIVNYDHIPRQEFLKQFSAMCRKRNTWCGSSYTFRDLSALGKYYRQACLALRYGQDKSGTINAIEDYALEYLRQQIGENMDGNITSPALEQLKQYDAAAGTEYYLTLRVYLLNERDQKKTAELLCIHRNTLIYRIRKIESIIDADLDDPRSRFLLLEFLYITDPDFFK